jgi:Fe-S-cluster-containing hydrogenase component 2
VTVKIDTDKCGHITNCPAAGLCIQICESEALVNENDDVKVIDGNCTDCDLCIMNCPNQAISKA